LQIRRSGVRITLGALERSSTYHLLVPSYRVFGPRIVRVLSGFSSERAHLRRLAAALGHVVADRLDGLREVVLARDVVAVEHAARPPAAELHDDPLVYL